MKRERGLEMVVGILLAGVGVSAVGATSATTGHHDASGWWTAMAACLAAAIWLVVMSFAVLPLLDWRRAKRNARRAEQPKPAAQSKRERRLVITSAIYGVHGREIDVTDRLNGLVVDDVLDIVVDNDTMGGDPAPGIGKMLRLRWTLDGKPDSSAFTEGTHAVVP